MQHAVTPYVAAFGVVIRTGRNEIKVLTIVSRSHHRRLRLQLHEDNSTTSEQPNKKKRTERTSSIPAFIYINTVRVPDSTDDTSTKTACGHTADSFRFTASDNEGHTLAELCQLASKRLGIPVPFFPALVVSPS